MIDIIGSLVDMTSTTHLQETFDVRRGSFGLSARRCKLAFVGQSICPVSAKEHLVGGHHVCPVHGIRRRPLG